MVIGSYKIKAFSQEVCKLKSTQEEVWAPGQLSLVVVLREQNSRKATHAREVAVAFSFKGVKEY